MTQEFNSTPRYGIHPAKNKKQVFKQVCTVFIVEQGNHQKVETTHVHQRMSG